MSSLSIDPKAKPAPSKPFDPSSVPFDAMPSIVVSDKLLKEWREEWRELCEKSAKQSEWLVANRPQGGWSDAFAMWERRASVAASVSEQIIELEGKINRLVEQVWATVAEIEDPVERERITKRILLYAEAPF